MICCFVSALIGIATLVICIKWVVVFCYDFVRNRNIANRCVFDGFEGRGAKDR